MFAVKYQEMIGNAPKEKEHEETAEEIIERMVNKSKNM